MVDRAADVPSVRRDLPEDAVATVFARAAELDLERAPDGPQVQLDEEALVEIGAAVGLSPEAVRRAIAEHRAGALEPSPISPATWVGPRLAVAERHIDGDADDLRRSAERRLERQWFRKVRDQGERSVWCARTDLPARVGRTFDFRHRLVLHGVSGIVVTAVDCPGDGVAVRLEADPAERRNGLGWAVAGATTGGATAGAVLAFLSGIGAELLLAVGAAGLGGGGGVVVARRSYGSQVQRLTDDLEGILDRLERPGR
ncbi:MAG: hypothetical protein WD232_10695 [Acidimicrobiales bacterium]